MDAVIEQINSAGKAFVDFAWPMLVQSSILIAILLAADFLLRKNVRAVFRYWLWMLVLIKLVLPTTLSSPVSVGRIIGEPVASVRIAIPERPVVDTISDTQPPLPAAESAVVSQVGLPLAAPIRSQSIVPMASLTWQGGAFLLWLVVVIAMALLLLQRAVFVCGLVRQSMEANGLMNDTLRFCCKLMGVKQTIGLKVSPNATSPAVCGLFRPVILVPQGLDSSLGISSLRVVLMHELAHIKRGDLWVNLIQTLLQIAYFYNPLLWLANWVIRRVREQAVDEAVQVALGEKANQYPETLLSVAKLVFQRPALSLCLVGVVESKSALTGRIKRMLTRPIPKTAKLGIIGSLVLVLLAAVLLPMAKAVPPPEFVIKGTVTDAQTGKPVAGAKVGDAERYAGGKYGAVTDSSGNYSYKTWYEEHDVKCEAAGYKTETKVILTKVLGSEQEKVLDFAISSKKNGDDGFKATLSNGKIIKNESGKVTYRVDDKITLEILGITNWPVAVDSKWWGADGVILKEAPLNWSDASRIADMRSFGKDEPGQRFIVVAHAEAPAGTTTLFTAQSLNGAEVTVPASTATKDKTAYIVCVTEKTLKNNALAIVGKVADGVWQTVDKFYIGGDAGTTTGGMTYTVADAGWGTTNVTLNSTEDLSSYREKFRMDSRVAAIDKKGRVHTQNGGGTGVSTGGLHTQQLTYGLSRNEIDHLELQHRPFTIYEFRNVSFEPGVKTDVQALQQALQPIGFKITSMKFKNGDSIEITDLSGPDGVIRPGETYVVSGRYSLKSHDEAALHVYATNGEVQSSQGPLIKRGEGQFTRTFTVLKEGDLHLSFYPADGGDSFGGVYFAPKKSEGVEDASSVRARIDGQVKEQLKRDPIILDLDKKISEQESLLANTRTSHGENDLEVLQLQELISSLKEEKQRRETQIIGQTRRAAEKEQVNKTEANSVGAEQKKDAEVVDVAVESFNIQSYPEGGLYSVFVSIRNKGVSTNPNFRVYFYKNDPERKKPVNNGAGPITPGGLWHKGSMPFALQEGTNEIAVLLDPDNTLGDSDRTNNEASMKVVVKDGKIVEKKVTLPAAKDSDKQAMGLSERVISAAEFGDTNGANAGKENRMSKPEKTGPPVVVKTTPVTYANDVSPDLNNITVTFNQRMADKSWSWVRWDAPYPETTGSPYYDNAKRICTLPVKLEPGQAYLVAFNIEPYIGFVNAAGEPARPYVLVFATKDKDGKPTPIPEELITKAKSVNESAQKTSSEPGKQASKTEPIPYTQVTYDEIRPDGTIFFKNTIRETNKSGREITTNNFINSDFVHVTAMSDADGRELKFTSIHDGDIYRYEVTFNKPILPGGLIEYTSEGTMDGLIKPVSGSKDTFQYYMKHHPAAGRPTQRAETYLLPTGAELISTTPEDMERRTKDGRIELHVEKMIPPGGSITTSFRYRMPEG